GPGALGLLPPPARASGLAGGAGGGLGLVPARVADGAGLVEQAALGASERHRVVGVDAAALDHLTRRQRAGGIVPAVGAYGHAPLSQTIGSCCDRRTGGLLHLRPPRRGHP